MKSKQITQNKFLLRQVQVCPSHPPTVHPPPAGRKQNHDETYIVTWDTTRLLYTPAARYLPSDDVVLGSVCT